MKDCLFCKIMKKEIPAKILAENENVVAIMDISPQAKFHALVMPKKHIASLNQLEDQDRVKLLPEMYSLAHQLAVEGGFCEDGYRTVINNQANCGQTVFHLHMHVLSDSKLSCGFGA